MIYVSPLRTSGQTFIWFDFRSASVTRVARFRPVPAAPIVLVTLFFFFSYRPPTVYSQYSYTHTIQYLYFPILLLTDLHDFREPPTAFNHRFAACTPPIIILLCRNAEVLKVSVNNNNTVKTTFVIVYRGVVDISTLVWIFLSTLVHGIDSVVVSFTGMCSVVTRIFLIRRTLLVTVHLPTWHVSCWIFLPSKQCVLLSVVTRDEISVCS